MILGRVWRQAAGFEDFLADWLAGRKRAGKKAVLF
jgi:hypothetical protein